MKEKLKGFRLADACINCVNIYGDGKSFICALTGLHFTFPFNVCDDFEFDEELDEPLYLGELTNTKS